MDNLLRQLETLKIRDDLYDVNSWTLCVDLIERSFAPQRTIGMERPCEEKDFREYRLVVERNLHNIKSVLQHISNSCKENNLKLGIAIGIIKKFGMNLLLLIGEHIEKNIWNTAECVSISKELLAAFCDLYSCENVTEYLSKNENFIDLLLLLRPKLLKDTWKTYPSAVVCYRWILQKAKKPILFNYIEDVLPTTLIILDDYFPDNVTIGLECVHEIILHSYMKRGLIDTGYGQAIYHTLELLSHQKEVRYIIPLYSCMTNLLFIMAEMENTNRLEWSKRDDVISILIDNMEFEQNIELRHAYMLSINKLLTDLGCLKWREALTRVLVEYCEHHTDLKTLKATLETAKTFLLLLRTHHLMSSDECAPLYTAFLKLHVDLIKTPIFDHAIIENLEDCICILNHLSPNIGFIVLSDSRVLSINNKLPLIRYNGDIKYFE